MSEVGKNVRAHAGQDIVAALRDDARQLQNLLGRLTDAAFSVPTAFKGWTSDDVLRHLLRGNEAARLALADPEALAAMMRASPLSRRELETAFARGATGHDLVSAWGASVDAVADSFARIDLSQRLSWAGHSMSARSLLSARLMEQWSHSQAIFDLVGIKRIETDRIYPIVMLGINAFTFTFRTHGLPMPDHTPRAELIAPSGAIWSFGDGDEGICGTAVDFCRVVTQTRHIADTALTVTGDTARAWMNHAQCFAGPPHAPPAPGSRSTAPTVRADLLTSIEGLVAA